MFKVNHILILLIGVMASGLTIANAQADQTPVETVSAAVTANSVTISKDDHTPPLDLSPLGMYQSAHVVVKTVMLILVFASFLSWAIGIGKQLQIVISRRRNFELLRQLLPAQSLAEVKKINPVPGGVGKDLLQATYLELELSQYSQTNADGIKERLYTRLERSQIQATSHINQGIGILASIGSVAPFIGLFGTVWGIMNAFVSISQAKTTNLAVVAPGIAEALMATAFGLIAAIPAVLIYNHFSRAITGYKNTLADIAAALLILVSRDLDLHYSNENK